MPMALAVALVMWASSGFNFFIESSFGVHKPANERHHRRRRCANKNKGHRQPHQIPSARYLNHAILILCNYDRADFSARHHPAPSSNRLGGLAGRVAGVPLLPTHASTVVIALLIHRLHSTA